MRAMASEKTAAEMLRDVLAQMTPGRWSYCERCGEPEDTCSCTYDELDEEEAS
jgi:hypothetical protein